MPKRFYTARPFFVLGLVLAVWLILPIFVKRFLRVSFFEMQAPVDLTASYIRDLQEYWSMRTRSRNELIAAGRDLVRLNANYEVTLQRNESLRQEIARLESILKLPAFAEYRSEVARVTRRDFTGWWQRLVIRKGRNYGLTVGSPVIFSGGVVGRVSEVAHYTAVVEMVSSPGFRLAATLDGDTRPMTYQGADNPPFTSPRGLVENVPVDNLIVPNAPKRLVTSGLGGVFPAGLIIGEVTRLDVSADGLFKTGDVRLDPRLSELAEVTVLVPIHTE